MRKFFCFMLIFTLFSSAGFSFFEFSGSVGPAFYFGTETVKVENTIMEHHAVGVMANFYATTPINLGLWLRFAYMVPYFYGLEDLLYPEYSGIADLTYIFTQFLDFSAGITYIAKFNKYFSLPIALGFNFIQNIISPRISYTYGIIADVAFRATMFQTITATVGVSISLGFVMDFISQGLQYKQDYTLLSACPYISVGFLGKPPLREAPKLPHSDDLAPTKKEVIESDPPERQTSDATLPSSSAVANSNTPQPVSPPTVAMPDITQQQNPAAQQQNPAAQQQNPAAQQQKPAIPDPPPLVVTNDIPSTPAPAAPAKVTISLEVQRRINAFRKIFSEANVENVTMTEDINGNMIVYLNNYSPLPTGALTVVEIRRIKSLADCLRPLRKAEVEIIAHVNTKSSVEVQKTEAAARIKEVEAKLIAFYGVDKTRLKIGTSNVIPNKELGNCIEIIIKKGTF